jgi:rhamnosyltransferase subunit B
VDLPEPVRHFLAEGAAPIIFTLGSSAVYMADDFYNMAVRTVKRLGPQYRAIFLVGNTEN